MATPSPLPNVALDRLRSGLRRAETETIVDAIVEHDAETVIIRLFLKNGLEMKLRLKDVAAQSFAHALSVHAAAINLPEKFRVALVE